MGEYDLFTICLCVSPDFDGYRYRAYIDPGHRGHLRYVSRHVCSLVLTICFTICLFISPDLDGCRAPQKALTLQDPQGLETQIRSHRVMFASKYRPDFDGLN